MVDRVYILLDIVDGKAEQIAQALPESPGIVMGNLVESTLTQSYQTSKGE